MKALIVVDVQNDFCTGGTLAVPDAERIIPFINQLIDEADADPFNWKVWFTKDWHPPETAHFNKWPVHCVSFTNGAEIHSGLHYDNLQHRTILKGTSQKDDGYSAFDGKNEFNETLHEDMQKLGINEIVVVGLATDYCVKATVLDALKLGYHVTVFDKGVAAVGIKPFDEADAFGDMWREGADIFFGDQKLEGNIKNV